MVVILASVGFVLGVSCQEPPPARVPGPRREWVGARDRAALTLYDGFDAAARVCAAWDAADEALRGATQSAARADAALVAAALRLECVDGDVVTRALAGAWSDGVLVGEVQLRVRGLFPVPELASREVVGEGGGEAGRLVSVDDMHGASHFPADCHDVFPMRFDAEGRFVPVTRTLQVGPMGPYACSVELVVSGLEQGGDRVRLVNRGLAPRDRVGDDLLGDAGAGSDAKGLEGARRAFRARSELVVDSVDLERSAEFLFRGGDDDVHGAGGARFERAWWPRIEGGGALACEAAMLRAGRSPYGVREGTKARVLWRTHAHGGSDIPSWTGMPRRVDERGAPVVIVLHEVGFDEGWAVVVGGRGELVRACVEAGWVVVAPANRWLEADAAAMEALLRSVEAEGVAVDRGRVGVVAPRSGMGLATRLAADGGVAGVRVVEWGGEGEVVGKRDAGRWVMAGLW